MDQKDTSDKKAFTTVFKKMDFSRRQLLIFALIFAVIGGYVLWHTFAAAPQVASLEAEQMSLPQGAGLVSDSTASGGNSVMMTTNGTLSGTVNFPSSVNAVTIMAKGVQCQGAPLINATLDGTTILTNTSISSTGWAAYTANASLNSGSHNFSISFTNAYSKVKGKSTNLQCTRKLYLDVSRFYGPNATTPAPTVTLSATPTTVTAGQASTLTWNSTDADQGCTASGAWSGSQPASGSASTGAVNQTSTYTLTCTGAGGSASSSATVNVTTIQLSASFSAAPTSGTAPLTVNFTDSSTGGPTAWAWDFGDGTNSSVQNPSHTYSSQGVYSVSLTINNSSNTSTVTKSSFITVNTASTGGQTMVTPEGVTIKVDSNVTNWTPQQIYDLLKPNAYELNRIGPMLTINVQTVYTSSTTTGVSGSGCGYYNFKAKTSLDARPDRDFNVRPDKVIGHEYGLVWAFYHLYMSQCGSWAPYLSERNIANDPRLGTSINWDTAEMLGDDYRMLFGTQKAIDEAAYINPDVPDPRTVSGLKDWMINSWGKP